MEIILIDDDNQALTMARMFLERAQLDCEAFSEPTKAIERMTEKAFDVMIVDLSMPQMDGFEMLRWAKENRPDMVSIVLSGTTSIQDVITAMEQGAYDFCTKPLDRAILIRKVGHALEHKALQDQSRRLLAEIQDKNIELENRLHQLELAHRMFQNQSRAIQADLFHARDIQQGLLPKRIPCHEQLSMAVHYRPANKVGGDFFDIFPLPDGKVGLYIADTAGHGVSSALVTVFLKHAMQQVLHEAHEDKGDPGPILRKLNTMLFQQPFGHDLFISMLMLTFDPATMELCYASAGHPCFILRARQGQVRTLRLSAPALGINPSVKYGSASVQLEPEDMVVLYTDGATETVNPEGKFFGLERIQEIIAASPPSPVTVVKNIYKAIHTFRENVPLGDDLTLVALSATPQEEDAITFVFPEDERASEALPASSSVNSADENTTTYISVSGTGTWRESKLVAEMVEAARIKKQSRVILDFNQCTHLDSTFLGVLHNLCAHTEEMEGFTLQLQNLPRPLLRLMSELGLTKVLLCFRAKARALPQSMEHLENAPMSRAEMSRILLGAHEALIEADPTNADRFAAVIQVLQRETQEQGGD